MDLCRLCVKAVDPFITKSVFDTNCQEQLQHIEIVIGETLKNDLNLPIFLCEECELSLEQAYKFRETCIKNQIYFNSEDYLSRLEFQTQNNDKDLIFANYDNTFEEAEEGANYLDTFAQNVDDEVLYNIYDGKELEVFDSEYNEHTSDSIYLEEFISDQEGKYTDVQEKPLKISKQININQKANYICEHCGHLFVSRNQCLTHLRRHTGDKPFMCKFCVKKFVTKNELNRHLRTHTGERPYTCQYCDRSYPDASKRLKHERAHRNDRKFSCPHCDKAFTSSSILKSHLLTHTNERLYKCELCQKSFQRRAHLLTHYHSRSHKVREQNQKSYYKYQYRMNLCRLCLKLIDPMVSQALFDSAFKSELQQLQILIGTMIENNVYLPQHICEHCEQNLKRTCKFSECCIESQQYFQTRNYKKKMQYIKKFKEEFESEESLTYTSVQELINENLDTNDIILTIQPKEDIDEIAKSGDISEDIVDNEFIISYPDVEVHENADNLKTDDEASANKFVITKDEDKTFSKKYSKREKTNFICDQCGNNFSSRNHFLIHLKRHSGDKPFQCELCPDKFFTHTELKRHMRKHTGERPFACKYCDRRFSDYSTRVKHERTHTNERPFSCTQCGKSFTTSYILKNHMLTHTGERSFKCTLCSKSFQRQTHLVVHYRSISHKQNEEKQNLTLKL
ncbi:zinc finger protein 436-like [Teleopsis dalmanni]|uniref:zinc finger protein 436-like n=1 Tax=Teleopsis dalmanni TaxID=139649 RepID=UPI0018CFB5FD|nr:zinc finger protein 436-like [Teleopsis dalmanni]